MSTQDSGKDSRDGQDEGGPPKGPLTEKEKEVQEFMDGMRRERQEAEREEERNIAPAPTPIDAAQVEAAMNGDLQEFVRNALMTTRFQRRHYQRAAEAANRMGGAAHLQEALVALDAADWDLGGALQQHDFDVEVRREAAQTQPPQQDRDPQRGLDRSRASGGVNWHPDKLTLRIKWGKGWKVRKYQDINDKFDVKDPSPMDILRLNRWRHETITKYAGPLRSPQGQVQGDWWHPATIRDIRKRFLDRMRVDIQKPGYEIIAQEHNNLFRDVLLPGVQGKVPERNHTQVSSALDRYFYRKGHRQKKLSQRQKREKMVEEIEKVQKKEKKQCKEMDARDFTSTIEELEAVMREELKLQEDTADEEEQGEALEGEQEGSDAPGEPEEPEDEEGDDSGSEYRP